MQLSVAVGDVLGAIATRVGADDELSFAWEAHAPSDGIAAWVLRVVSLLALLVAGGAATHLARRLVRRSTPELTALLNQSAAFYGRWSDDRLGAASRVELSAEAARCRRIVELLQEHSALIDDRGPVANGHVRALQAWIALLGKRIECHPLMPSETFYA